MRFDEHYLKESETHTVYHGSNTPIKNDMDFVSWKAELNRGLASFWESITEETQG